MRGQITLNENDQKRVMILNKVSEGELTGQAAADLLGRSLRQLRRLLARYRKKGAAAVIHGNRGRSPVNAFGRGIARRIVALARKKYLGVNQQHFSELLGEREKIAVSRSSVRRFLEKAGIVSPRPQRRRKHRSRRDRYSQEGMLVQIDASWHRWFGQAYPKATLFAAIDDATGKVLAARFGQREDAQGYVLLLEDIVRRCGRPIAVYRDRHNIFQVNMKRSETVEEQLRGEPDLSQFGRILKELGIESKAAGSPQAKGRIERLFGTFQDRLVQELRLDVIDDRTAANAWLPQFLGRYNRRFAVPARISGTVYRALPADLENAFCFKYQRTVGSDNTVRFLEHRIQIQADRYRASYARARVEVHQDMNGGLAIYYRGRCLATKAAPLEAPVLRTSRQRRWKKASPEPPAPAVKPRTERTSKSSKPAVDHPWRRSFKTMTPQPARRLPFPVAADVLRRSQN
jgi:transposase